ncbi:MAG: aspartate/glutamate racemase family protein, partial [Anaerolineae bacterium]|nr:aspartate/glutamate racemase family protein [Anaerolineae bacterium]
MPHTIVLVHTVAPLVGVFQRLGAEMLPDVRLLHILDEPLLERVRRRGSLAPEDGERLCQHASAAEAVGAAAVLVTCSTVSPCVDAVRAAARIPVLKIDEAMIAEAVSRGRRVGVVATAPTTLEPTRQALESRAA